MGHRDIVVIGASAGGVEALSTLAGNLKAVLPASYFVVMHSGPGAPMDGLATIISRSGPLRAKYPKDREPIRKGTIYVARPDYHMVLEKSHVRLVRGPKENRFRPAIDPLFRSAGEAFNSRVIGVILSGMLSDGVAGLQCIKECGGTLIVQDPKDALFSDLPTNAVRQVQPEHVLPLSKIGPMLAELIRKPAKEHAAGNGNPETKESALEATIYSCPDCGGQLWQVQQGRVELYRCQIGHQYSLESLNDAQDDVVEDSVWTAIRMFEARAQMLDHMADNAVQTHSSSRLVKMFRDQAGTARENSRNLRKILAAKPPPKG